MATPLLSTIAPIYGPIIGMFLAKPAIVPRKSPNKTNMPYNSTRNPVNGHLMRISASPAKNAPVPLSFCFRAKNTIVFCGPIIIVNPIKKRIYIECKLESPLRAGKDTNISHCKPENWLASPI